MNFGQRLAELRSERGLTQEELANRLDISRSAIGMYERGEREPSFDLLDKLTDFFGVGIGYMLGATNLRTRYPRHGDDAAPQNTDEVAILSAYRSASHEIQAAVRAVLGIR